MLKKDRKGQFMHWVTLGLLLVPLLPAAAQEPEAPPTAAEKTYRVEPRTLVPLILINSVSTRNAAEGDRIYLETVFPVLVDGKIVIPPGSWVAGTVTQVKRPGRVKGRGELFVRFDSLTLPNGVTRDFRAGIGGIDGRSREELDRTEGKIKGESNKGGDARTVGEVAGTGATIGGIAGGSAGRAGMGLGVGAAAGAAAGLVGVLLTRGPDAVLARGTTIEMILDRPLDFSETETEFSNGSRRSSIGFEEGGPASGRRDSDRLPLPGRRGRY